MRIIITQEEIEQAIENHILDQVRVPDDMRIDIALKATRGDEGYTAEIDIVDSNAPTDGSDRSIDDRVQPVAGAETLGIAEKIMEAKQAAQLPRRRGRPPGVRNRPKNEQPQEAPQEAVQDPREQPVENEVVNETPTEVEVENEAPVVNEQPIELVGGIENNDPIPEPEPDHTAEELAAHAEMADEQPQPQPEPEPVPEPTPAPAAAPEVSASDVSTQASPELVESVSDPVPETPAPAPVRSLFANLGRPTNSTANG